MIKFKVGILLAEHGKTQSWLVEHTGIRPGTVSKLWHNTVQRIDIEHLNSICNVFNCRIEDVMEFVPDNPLPLNNSL